MRRVLLLLTLPHLSPVQADRLFQSRSVMSSLINNERRRVRMTFSSSEKIAKLEER